jgi:hypothetical protein
MDKVHARTIEAGREAERQSRAAAKDVASWR